MKSGATRLWAATACVLVAGGIIAQAQLLPANASGLTMGFVLLNVTSVDAHRAFWVEAFDAKPLKVGRLDGVVIPGLVVLLRPQPPSGPVDGETINHLGLKLSKLSTYTDRFDRGGWKYDAPRVGRENTPQTYVTGPDGFRMELVEDPTLPAPVVAHHLHYFLVDQAAVKTWYVDRLLLTATMRGPYPSADVPGMNLTFAPLGRQGGPGVATRGRLLDQIGFEVSGLTAYCDRLKRAGVAVDPRPDAELGLPSATLVDPWGVTIRLTEGLAKEAGTTPFHYRDRYIQADR